MQKYGAVHVQIGQAYDLLGTREPQVAALLRQIKQALDPQRLVNPGSLGLWAPSLLDYPSANV